MTQTIASGHYNNAVWQCISVFIVIGTEQDSNCVQTRHNLCKQTDQ